MHPVIECLSENQVAALLSGPLAADAQAWLARHDIVSPSRMIAMLTPAFEPP